jgi:hypothetical protein
VPIVIAALAALWKKCAESQPERMQAERKMHFYTFLIDDADTAEKISHWMDQDKKSRDAIQRHLDRIVPQQYRRVPLQYSRDMNGHLMTISYCGMNPQGWKTISEESTLLEPSEHAAVAAVKALPASSRQQLHDLINWPTIQEHDAPADQLIYVRQVNRLVVPVKQDGKIYVRVPHPDNYKTSCPMIAATLRAWDMPSAMQRTDPKLRP